MFRIVQIGQTLPYSWPVDPSAEFEPGQIAQLKALGNQIVAGVCDGTAPLGIIDDMKKNAFSAVSMDEEVIVEAVGVLNGNGDLVSDREIKVELNNPNITSTSFISRSVDVVLNPRNGTVTFPAGTLLNYCTTDSGTPDAIRTVVSYSYQIPNIPGDNSTIGSGRITVWVAKGIFETDQYETNQRYPLNAPLFVNESGRLTTRRIHESYPSIGIVTAPPSLIHSGLQFLWT